MTRNLQALRTAIQPRLDAGDNNTQIQTWLRAGIENADISDGDYKAWRLNVGTALARLEARRAILSDKIQNDPANVSGEEATEFDAISEAVTAANNAQGLQLSNPDERTRWNSLQPSTFTTAEINQLFALSDNKRLRWQVLNVWDARISEIEEARQL